MGKRLKYHYHTELEAPVPERDIFVFGSNLAGLHRELHSQIASLDFGAETGVAVGLTGRSYAIPVKDRFIRVLSIPEIRRSVAMFKELTLETPDQHYFVARLELDLNGVLKTFQIAPLFSGCGRNCCFPVQWKPFLK